MNNFPGCPYQVDDGYNDRNRFPHGHLFVGEIENGKRYPYDTYSKAEADERYAVKQTEADLAALTARVEALEYVDIKINSFNAAPPVSEIGSSQTVTLAWSLNKQATSQNINGTAVTGNSKTYTGVTSSTSYTLNVSDGETSASKTVGVSFANRIYYGAAVNLASITELNNVLSNDPERTITVTAGPSEYIIYAYPERLGDVAFYVGGFEGGFEEQDGQTITNQYGYSEKYKIFKSINTNLGETVVDIREV